MENKIFLIWASDLSILFAPQDRTVGGKKAFTLNGNCKQKYKMGGIREKN